MGKLVNMAHNAFVAGKWILDVSLIMNELVNSSMKKEERKVLCKLDIEKTYDTVNWNLGNVCLDN